MIHDERLVGFSRLIAAARRSARRPPAQRRAPEGDARPDLRELGRPAEARLPSAPLADKQGSGAAGDRAAAQALAQEQAAFEREMQKDGALFRLALVMGWTTFLMVPATVIAAFVYPRALTGLVPLSGLAFWNWRRVLRRDGKVGPTTSTSKEAP
jgi:hypothetical protein